MPRLSGPELAVELRRLYPSLPILFMTGYADDGALRHAALAEEPRVLLKPFLPKELARRVRELLDDCRGSD
jgi:CheY-like chemotaxis protein